MRSKAVELLVYQPAMTSIVTTYLEMHSPDQLRPKRCTDRRFHIQEQIERDWRFNRDLYLAVGQMWSWNDKRVWSDEQWKEYGLAPELRTFAAYYEHTLAGYYELRHDDGGGVEIAYFGLLPEFIGRRLRSEEHTSELQSRGHLVCRLLLEKKKKNK